MEQSKRKFEVIKFRPFAGMQHVKIEYLDEIGDIYHECSDGWFENERTKVQRNIYKYKDFQEYFKPITQNT
jgi:hypothetical protein